MFVFFVLVLFNCGFLSIRFNFFSILIVVMVDVVLVGIENFLLIGLLMVIFVKLYLMVVM